MIWGFSAKRITPLRRLMTRNIQVSEMVKKSPLGNRSFKSHVVDGFSKG